MAWTLLAGPIGLVWGPRGLLAAGVAAAVCVLPGWCVFGLLSFVGRERQSQAIGVLAGTGLRMFAVLVAALAVEAQGWLAGTAFAAWLVVFYLVTLLVETVLVTRPAPAS
jgi:hypothetical protein